MEQIYVKKRVLDGMIDKRVVAQRDITPVAQIVGDATSGSCML